MIRDATSFGSAMSFGSDMDTGSQPEQPAKRQKREPTTPEFAACRLAACRMSSTGGGLDQMDVMSLPGTSAAALLHHLQDPAIGAGECERAELMALSVQDVLAALMLWPDSEHAGRILSTWWSAKHSAPWEGTAGQSAGWTSVMSVVPLLACGTSAEMGALGRIVGFGTDAYDDEEAGGIASSWAPWGGLGATAHAALVGAFLRGFCKNCRGGCGFG